VKNTALFLLYDTLLKSSLSSSSPSVFDDLLYNINNNNNNNLPSSSTSSSIRQGIQYQSQNQHFYQQISLLLNCLYLLQTQQQQRQDNARFNFEIIYNKIIGILEQVQQQHNNSNSNNKQQSHHHQQQFNQQQQLIKQCLYQLSMYYETLLEHIPVEEEELLIKSKYETSLIRIIKIIEETTEELKEEHYNNTSSSISNSYNSNNSNNSNSLDISYIKILYKLVIFLFNNYNNNNNKNNKNINNQTMNTSNSTNYSKLQLALQYAIKCLNLLVNELYAGLTIYEELNLKEKTIHLLLLPNNSNSNSTAADSILSTLLGKLNNYDNTNDDNNNNENDEHITSNEINNKNTNYSNTSNIQLAEYIAKDMIHTITFNNNNNNGNNTSTTTTRNNRQLARVYFILGTIYYRSCKFQQSLDNYELAIVHDTSSSNSTNNSKFNNYTGNVLYQMEYQRVIDSLFKFHKKQLLPLVMVPTQVTSNNNMIEAWNTFVDRMVPQLQHRKITKKEVEQVNQEQQTNDMKNEQVNKEELHIEEAHELQPIEQ